MFVKQSNIFQKQVVSVKLIYPDQKCHLVAICINNVIPSRSFVVDKELDGGHRLDLTQLREQFLAFGSGNRRQQ